MDLWGRTPRKSKRSSREKEECARARVGEARARDLCNDRKLMRYNERTTQLPSTNRIYGQSRVATRCSGEIEKIYRDCKLYAAEICGTESLTYGTRVCAHISTYRRSGKERARSRTEQKKRRKRIDWTRGCVNASTLYASQARAHGNYAHAQPCEKGAESAKGE